MISGVREQTVTPHDIMMADGGICSIFYIFDSLKKNYNEGLKFYKGKRSSFSLNQNFVMLNDQFSNK